GMLTRGCMRMNMSAAARCFAMDGDNRVAYQLGLYRARRGNCGKYGILLACLQATGAAAKTRAGAPIATGRRSMGAASIESAGQSAARAGDEPPAESIPRFMSVRQVARYLQVNEKKVYALVADGVIPASKVTGKWLFPRDLVDQWLLESSHGGLLADRMLIAGSDDPVICRAIMHVANEVQSRALISYTPTGTQLGLSLLARRRADICGIHWGPAEESHQRHPALLKQHPPHNDWILVRIFLREQGLMVATSLAGSDPEQLFSHEKRWVMRQEGAGSQRFLQEIVTRHGLDPAARRVSSRAYSERDA